MAALRVEIDKLDQLQQAGLLSRSEHAVMVAGLRELELRREIDALDSAWEQTLKKHAGPKAKSKHVQLPSSKDALVGGVLSALFLAYTLYMVVQFLLYPDRGGFDLPLYFFGAGVVLAIFFVRLSRKAYRNGKAYERLGEQYGEERKHRWNAIPAEHRPSKHFCSNCLLWDPSLRRER